MKKKNWVPKGNELDGLFNNRDNVSLTKIAWTKYNKEKKRGYRQVVETEQQIPEHFCFSACFSFTFYFVKRV